MTIWAIADLHASRPDPESGEPVKPMDAFGPRWVDHLEKLERSWKRCVEDGDTVLVAGDIDWALRLHEALPTLQRLSGWGGRSILVRGNHDYWWSSKATNKVRELLPARVELLHNDALEAEGFSICGTKGSPVPGAIDWTPEHAKLLNREQQRLRLSLDRKHPELPALVALHFPPFYVASGASPYKDILEEYGAKCCVYGHLHGDAWSAGPRGLINGVDYRLVAGDFLDFRLHPLARDGRLLSG